MRELVSGTEAVPALSRAMQKRIELLNDSVDYMALLHARITTSKPSLLKPEVAQDLYKMLSHEFTEVLEVCRRCSADELVSRLDNLHLYQLIQNLTPAEKEKLRDSLTPKTVDVKVSEAVYHPIEQSTPVPSVGNPVPPTVTETPSLG